MHQFDFKKEPDEFGGKLKSFLQELDLEYLYIHPKFPRRPSPLGEGGIGKLFFQISMHYLVLFV